MKSIFKEKQVRKADTHGSIPFIFTAFEYFILNTNRVQLFSKNP